jgi:ribose-phosphate pyrophosphokinase
MKLFSGNSNKPLAGRIAHLLGLEVSPIEDFIFPDGERRIQIQVPVVDEDVIVVQSTNPPVDSHYMELFLIIDGLKRNGARSITVVMPYMGYMRQDHIFRDGEAVSLLVMINILESLKVDRFIGLDFHTIKVPEFFHIPVTHISALSLFAQEAKKRGWTAENTVLVSPDLGGLRRINQVSELLGIPWIATVKDRDVNTGSIKIEAIEGDKANIRKRALIIDDMISSGKTIVQSAELLKKHGIEEFHVFVTHPIFSAEAPKLLQESIITTVFVTDAVNVPEDKQFDKLEILSIADMIASNSSSIYYQRETAFL